eukprot:1323266-Amorphochlora_amoeboformis.AAC.1
MATTKMLKVDITLQMLCKHTTITYHTITNQDVWNVQKNQNYKWTHLIPPISAELRVAQEKADEEKLGRNQHKAVVCHVPLTRPNYFLALSFVS